MSRRAERVLAIVAGVAAGLLVVIAPSTASASTAAVQIDWDAGPVGLLISEDTVNGTSWTAKAYDPSQVGSGPLSFSTDGKRSLMWSKSISYNVAITSACYSAHFDGGNTALVQGTVTNSGRVGMRVYAKADWAAGALPAADAAMGLASGTQSLQTSVTLPAGDAVVCPYAVGPGSGGTPSVTLTGATLGGIPLGEEADLSSPVPSISPTPTPTPTDSASPTPTPTPTATPTPTPTDTPTDGGATGGGPTDDPVTGGGTEDAPSIVQLDATDREVLWAMFGGLGFLVALVGALLFVQIGKD